MFVPQVCDLNAFEPILAVSHLPTLISLYWVEVRGLLPVIYNKSARSPAYS
nr:hypothetical protein JUJ52_00775 [Virgibacillus sp. AGTR]